MCGFAGHLSLDDSTRWGDPSRILHRGPDETTVQTFGDVEVVFCRLAINAVSNGKQPFISDKDGLLTVVNGEIYNHIDLRKELSGLGVVFVTESDAEVVHWGFYHWGVRTFEKLEGMFAVAIYERTGNRLTFARDRLGKKPLYWLESGSNISFASELGALRLPPGSFSPTMLADYMLTDSVDWDMHELAPVNSLPGGHWAQIGAGGKKRGSFWNLEEAVAGHRIVSRSGKEWQEGFLSVLTESVSQRLMSQVPVGAFLSNGQDSKLVTAVASQLGVIDFAFTLQFDELSFDESVEARAFARHLGIPHEVVKADIESLAEIWELYREGIDEPVADSAILGEMLLARAAGPKTKVVLTGDGGDEILLGYQHVQAHGVAAIPGALSVVRFLLGQMRPLLSVSKDKYFSAGFVVDRFLRGANESDLVRRDLAWRASFTEDQVKSMVKNLDGEEVNKIYRATASLIPVREEFQSWEDRWSFLYLRSYLPQVILRKVDRATMRFGVEARSPLLDRAVVEYALAMPTRHKRGLLSPKRPISYGLKQTADVPAGKSRKHGMGVPLVTLLRGPLHPEVSDLADPEFLVEQGLFFPKAVEALVSSFREAPQAHVREIWSLLVFQNWWRRQNDSDAFKGG